MKHALAIVADYLVNALWSGLIGALLAVALALAQGQNTLSLSAAGSYALVGITCGTCSRAAIEGSFALFGASKALAYILNAAIIAAIILAFSLFVMGGFDGLRPVEFALIFGLPELGSALVVYATLDEASRLNRAFAKKRKELDD
jgi:hypothetical protein